MSTPSRTRLLRGLGVLMLCGVASAPASAHRAWMLPSSTVVSSDDAWVTVDAAISNDLFYFEHQPMRIEGVVATAPDGKPLKLENTSTGRYRSTFDVHLTQRGTYRIANNQAGLMASWKEGAEAKRWRGAAEGLAAAIPAGATDVVVTQADNRNELFVTSGAPTTTLFAPVGRGIELQPVTHPNDLVAGEPARFRFLLDGAPAAQLKVLVVPGGIRYRDQLQQMDLVTDSKGEVNIVWPAAGHYWLNATATDAKTSIPQATERRLSYATTLEVLAP
jgi:uncharacterized GH25 family protein